jgi:arylsulfatase A-like enzyme
MKNINFDRLLGMLALILISCIATTGLNAQQDLQEERPNVVLIFLDDGAFDDFEPFGYPFYPTPNVKQLATEGTSYYNFHVPQSICSASRAALLTGCYPGRT